MRQLGAAKDAKTLWRYQAATSLTIMRPRSLAVHAAHVIWVRCRAQTILVRTFSTSSRARGARRAPAAVDLEDIALTRLGARPARLPTLDRESVVRAGTDCRS